MTLICLVLPAVGPGIAPAHSPCGFRWALRDPVCAAQPCNCGQPVRITAAMPVLLCNLRSAAAGASSEASGFGACPDGGAPTRRCSRSIQVVAPNGSADEWIKDWHEPCARARNPGTEKDCGFACAA